MLKSKKVKRQVEQGVKTTRPTSHDGRIQNTAGTVAVSHKADLPVERAAVSPRRSSGGRADDRGRSALSHCQRPCESCCRRSTAPRAARAAPRSCTGTSSACRRRTVPDTGCGSRPPAHAAQLMSPCTGAAHLHRLPNQKHVLRSRQKR